MDPSNNNDFTRISIDVNINDLEKNSSNLPNSVRNLPKSVQDLEKSVQEYKDKKKIAQTISQAIQSNLESLSELDIINIKGKIKELKKLNTEELNKINAMQKIGVKSSPLAILSSRLTSDQSKALMTIESNLKSIEKIFRKSTKNLDEQDQKIQIQKFSNAQVEMSKMGFDNKRQMLEAALSKPNPNDQAPDSQVGENIPGKVDTPQAKQDSDSPIIISEDVKKEMPEPVASFAPPPIFANAPPPPPPPMGMVVKKQSKFEGEPDEPSTLLKSPLKSSMSLDKLLERVIILENDPEKNKRYKDSLAKLRTLSSEEKTNIKNAIVENIDNYNEIAKLKIEAYVPLLKSALDQIKPLLDQRDVYISALEMSQAAEKNLLPEMSRMLSTLKDIVKKLGIVVETKTAFEPDNISKTIKTIKEKLKEMEFEITLTPHVAKGPPTPCILISKKKFDTDYRSSSIHLKNTDPKRALLEKLIIEDYLSFTNRNIIKTGEKLAKTREEIIKNNNNIAKINNTQSGDIKIGDMKPSSKNEVNLYDKKEQTLSAWEKAIKDYTNLKDQQNSKSADDSIIKESIIINEFEESAPIVTDPVIEALNGLSAGHIGMIKSKPEDFYRLLMGSESE